MPQSTDEITILAEHQPLLKILDFPANLGDVVIWADINKAYKKRALTAHPDKGGSADAFHALGNAFKNLEDLSNNAIPGLKLHDPFGGFAKMDRVSEELKYKLSELRDAGLAIPTTITINLDGEEITCINNHEAYLIESKQKREDEARKENMNIIGCLALGSGAGIVGNICIGLMIGKYQSNASETRIAGLCSAGLMVIGGGLLMMNGFFAKQNKPSANNKRQHYEQKAQHERTVNTGP